MIIGIPKEIKDNEGRVALTPEAVKTLRLAGHRVIVQENAGWLSGFSNEEYLNAGARIETNPAGVWYPPDMVMKVKEPLPSEYGLLRWKSILFTFFHFSANPVLKNFCKERNVIAVPYECLRDTSGSRPILRAMSLVAGEVAADVGPHYLRQENGGKGILPREATVTIIGVAGTVGGRAYDILKPRVKKIHALDIVSGHIAERARFAQDFEFSNPENIAAALAESDLVMGAAVDRRTGAPKIISREMVRRMAPGSVIVDVAIDEGGVSETSKPTSHSHPTYIEEGVIHYCVPNIPGVVPRSSTAALARETLPYALEIASRGQAAIDEILSGC